MEKHVLLHLEASALKHRFQSAVCKNFCLSIRKPTFALKRLTILTVYFCKPIQKKYCHKTTLVLFVYLSILWKSEDETLKKKISQHYQCYRGASIKSRTSHISQTGAENALNKPHWPQPGSLVLQGKSQLTISMTVCWCFPALESLWGMEIWPKRTDTWRIPIKKLLLTTQMWNVSVGVQQLHKLRCGNIFGISCNFPLLFIINVP